MALKFDTVTRKIVYKGRELADTQPDGPVEDVVRQHALTIPELATANIEGPEITNGIATYTISARLGTKG
jgi:PRTRC genetic system protein C